MTAPTRAEVAVLAAAALVVWLAAWSLLLAVNGGHRIALVAPVVLAGLVVVGSGAALAWRRAAPDRPGALLVLVAAVAGAVMFAPAFPYGSSDRDPGVYAYTAYAIARTRTVHVPDPLGNLPKDSALRPVLDGQRVPGMHPESAGTALAGFFLTEPALAATAYDLGGEGGLRLLGPLLGTLALAAFGLALRRAVRPLAGLLAIALIAGDMLVVWQAKVPGPETLAQLGVAAALLAAVVAAETRQWWAATLAGVFAASVWLARPDGVLVVVLAVGLALLCSSRAALAGLAVLAPFAAWQSYGLESAYSERNGVPSLPRMLAGCALAALIGAGFRPLLASPRALRVARRVATGGAVTFVGLLVLRQLLAHRPQRLVPGAVAGGWAPYTIGRVTGFVTWAGLVLALGGIAAVTRPPARLSRWLLLVPAALGAPFLVDPHNSPDLMFWGRRFVPTVVPGLLLLAAAGLAALLERDRARRALGAVLGTVALVVPYGQSLPLRAHHEYAGTLTAARVAARASQEAEQAVYLWVRPGAGCCEQPAYLFAGAVWLRYGKASMTVAPEEAAEQAAAAAALPDHWPVLVVGQGTVPPFEGLHTRLSHYAVEVPVWERGGLTRPSRARRVLVEFTVWRYDPPRPA